MIGRIAAFALGVVAVLALAWLWLGVPASMEAGKRLGRERAERASGMHHVMQPLPMEFLEPAASPSAATPSAAAADPHRLAIRDPALTSTRVLHASATLLDEHGRPLPDGVLTLSDADGTLIARADADVSGRAELRAEVPDAYHGESRMLLVEFGAPGRAGTRGMLHSVLDDARHAFGEVELFRSRRLSGRLVDAGGAPVVGAELLALQNGHPRAGPSNLIRYTWAGTTAVTDAAGRFEFDALHTIHNTRVGRSAEHRNPHWLTPHLQAGFAPTFDAGDVIWDAAPGRELLRLRAVDASGAPIPEARAGVIIDDELLEHLGAPERVAASAQLGEAADASGWISVREPPITRMGPAVGVAVAAPGFVARRVSHAEARDAELVLERAPPLELALLDADTRRPLTDVTLSARRWTSDTRQPDVGAWITLEPAVGAGRWLLRDPLAGNVQLEVSAPGFGRRLVQLHVGDELGAVCELALAGPRAVSFRVHDHTGADRDDVRASLSGPNDAPPGGRRAQLAEQQPDGSFLVRGLVPGAHTLVLRSDAAPRVHREVQVGSAPHNDLGAFELGSFGEVLLTLRDAAGTGVERAPSARRLGVDDSTHRAPKQLDDGRWHYSKLAPGPWAFELEPGGHLEHDVQPDAVHELELTLSAPALIRGRVLRDGAPVPDALVFASKGPLDPASFEFLPSLPDDVGWTWRGSVATSHAVTDDRGEYTLELPAAAETCVFAVDLRAQRSPIHTLATTLGAEFTVDLGLVVGRAEVSGVVRHADTGELVADAAVCVDGLRLTRTDAEGRYRLEGLPEREVRLTARPEGISVMEHEVRLDLGATSPAQADLLMPEPIPEGLICVY